MVLLGPFNEHMLTDEGKQTYSELRSGVISWLAGRGIACCVPTTLPSEMYADASHPLAEGYAVPANQLDDERRKRHVGAALIIYWGGR
jgi:hypothetical protein